MASIPLVSRSQSGVSESVKKMLYLSVIFDNANYEYENVETAFENITSVEKYNQFCYQSSKILDVYTSEKIKDKYHKYRVCLLKIPTKVGVPYYVLWMLPCQTLDFSFDSDLWIRISGYRENDIKVFLEGLQKQGINIEKIKKMIDSWKSGDSMFSEIDWDCLLEGYQTNNTQSDCFISEFFLLDKWSCIGCQQFEQGYIYAGFSRKLLGGQIE